MRHVRCSRAEVKREQVAQVKAISQPFRLSAARRASASAKTGGATGVQPSPRSELAISSAGRASWGPLTPLRECASFSTSRHHCTVWRACAGRARRQAIQASAPGESRPTSTMNSRQGQRAREAWPNPSLEGTHTGMALGPRGARCHHPPRGPSAIPARAPQLKR